jgi:hypothetical protein
MTTCSCGSPLVGEEKQCVRCAFTSITSSTNESAPEVAVIDLETYRAKARPSIASKVSVRLQYMKRKLGTSSPKENKKALGGYNIRGFSPLTSWINIFARPFAAKIWWVRGNIHQIGSLQQDVTYHTTTNSNTYGTVYGVNQNMAYFNANTHSRSQTTATVKNYISLLKVGDFTVLNVKIPSATYYEALVPGAFVGCVFSRKGRELLYIKNFTQGFEFGKKPSFTGPNLAIFISFLALIGSLLIINKSTIIEYCNSNPLQEACKNMPEFYVQYQQTLTQPEMHWIAIGSLVLLLFSMRVRRISRVNWRDAMNQSRGI